MTEYKIGDRVPMPPKEQPRRMIDMVPNGEDIRSRVYGAHLRNQSDGMYPGGTPSHAYESDAIFVKMGRERLACEECGAEPGQPCISKAKDAPPGATLKNLHNKRYRAARAQFGRKKS